MVTVATKPEDDDLENLSFTPLAGSDQSEQPGPGSSEPPKEPELSNAQIIAGALGAGRDVFCLVTSFHTPKATLSNEACAVLGDAWGKVCDKRGWNLQSYLGDYAAEIAAAMATVAIAKSVSDGVKAEIAAREARPAAASPADEDRTVDAGS